MTSSEHIEALFSLLDDPDPFVQEAVRQRMLDIGTDVATRLRQTVGSSGDGRVKEAATSILSLLGLDRFRNSVDQMLKQSEGRDDIDLESGVLAVAYIGWPELNGSDCNQQLDTMASMVEDRVRRCDNGYMVVREMNRYLIDQLGFHACRPEPDSYYDPDHSFINRILEERTANPVGLSVVYLLIARRLRIPLYGVGFPSHFLLKYRSLGEEFFVDPFNGGQILSSVDCRRFLRDLDIEYRPSYLDAINNRRIIARIMRNLAEIYSHRDSRVAAELQRSIEKLLDDAAWGGHATESQRPWP